MVSQASSVLLILADGRFPAGGHAHSGGLEQAVMSGRVRDVEDLFTYLVGRLVTMGRTDAALAALCWSAAPSADDVSVVQAEAVARAPSPALREASMAQGRSLLRAAAAVWPEAKLGWPPELAAPWAQGPMYPVALGAVGKGAGLGLEEVALVAAQSAVSGSAWASTRLLGLDPFAVAQCLVRLAQEVEDVAAAAVRSARDAHNLARAAAALPAHSAPLIEIGAEIHQLEEVCLFAS